MRPRLVQLLMCLILGAVVSVLVAWAAARAYPPGKPIANATTNTWYLMGRGTPDSIESYVTSWSESRAPGVRVFMVFDGLVAWADPSDVQVFTIDDMDRMPVPQWVVPEMATKIDFIVLDRRGGGSPGIRFPYDAWQLATYGWPARAMYAGVWGNLWGGGAGTFSPAYAADGPLADVPLPFGVIWTGTVVNTLFYGVMLWSLFAAVAALRRWRLRRAGRCIACGYVLHASASVCSECGRDAPKMKRAGADQTGADAGAEVVG